MKILLTIILLTLSFNANARPLANLSKEQLKVNYFKALKGTPDNQKIFIKANTVACGSIKGFKKLKVAVLDGINIYERNLDNFGCNLIEGRSVGVVGEAKGDYYFLVYQT